MGSPFFVRDCFTLRGGHDRYYDRTVTIYQRIMDRVCVCVCGGGLICGGHFIRYIGGPYIK